MRIKLDFRENNQVNNLAFYQLYSADNSDCVCVCVTMRRHVLVDCASACKHVLYELLPILRQTQHKQLCIPIKIKIIFLDNFRITLSHQTTRVPSTLSSPPAKAILFHLDLRRSALPLSPRDQQVTSICRQGEPPPFWTGLKLFFLTFNSVLFFYPAVYSLVWQNPIVQTKKEADVSEDI